MWYTGKSTVDYPRRIHYADSPDGIHFTKYGVVVDIGGTNDFDGVQTQMPCVIFHNGLWKMWYVGHKNTTGRGWYTIGFATSPTGKAPWTKYGKVFDVSSDPDAFDSDTVREPSVIYDKEDSLFKMWYNGTKVGEHFGCTGFATSPDGIIWTRVSQITSDAEIMYNGEVIKLNGVYYMWHNSGPDIDYSVSRDGIHWTRCDCSPVIKPAPGTFYSAYCQAPSPVYDSTQKKLYLYFNGADTLNETCRIGVFWTIFNQGY
jgi:hypothetical protein